MSKSYDVIAGYYGFGNFGDDLFRDILYHALGQTDWAAPRVSQNYAGSIPTAKILRNFRAIRNILQASSVTLGGGSILGARGKIGIRHVELAVTSTLCKPYCAIGVGLLEGLDSLPDNMLKRMSWIGLRSEAEYNQLSGTYSNLHYTSDLAYAALQILGISLADCASRNEIAIIPAGVGELGRSATNDGWLHTWLIENIVPTMAKVSGVKLLRLQPNNPGDMRATDSFERALSSLNIPVRSVAHKNATDTVKELASSTFVFTDRLHGAILAHICGVPFRLSKHHKKCIDLLRELGHPDAAGECQITKSRGDHLFADWTCDQDATVSRHSQLALTGIESWLGHLRHRRLG